ncbi:WecB/TagA/CpsF family glycosyltransferase [Sphingomonas humi]|uniref:WecB/TagA/CpsF family glycosyltransferase n=1 Tax=Sphingomonas humi TaxID=335630 RepID=A0ABP7RQ86_9SPHN
MEEVLARLSAVTDASPYGYVVTPNVDHVVRLDDPQERAELLPLYEQADLSLCDSRIIAHLGRLRGLSLPLVPGSDLTARLFAEVIRPGNRIAVVGGSRAMVAELQRRYPGVNLLHYEAPMGLRRNEAARIEAARFVAEAKPRFTFIAVGSPQQELIADAVRAFPGATGMAFCIGASLDFITGHERRAPKVLQRLSLEWVHRLASDPKRLWRRYLVEGPRIFVMAARPHQGIAKP